MTTTYHSVEVRVHRLHGPAPKGCEQHGARSPWLVAVDSVNDAADEARGFRMHRPVDTFRAADDGFGNLLRVPS